MVLGERHFYFYKATELTKILDSIAHNQFNNDLIISLISIIKKGYYLIEIFFVDVLLKSYLAHSLPVTT